MKPILIGSVAAGAAAVGIALVATSPSSVPLSDVEVPAVQLSSAEGVDVTVAWLDLFAQSTGGNTLPFDANMLDWRVTGNASNLSLIIVDPQSPVDDFKRILDGAVDGVDNQLGVGDPVRDGSFIPKPGS